MRFWNPFSALAERLSQRAEAEDEEEPIRDESSDAEEPPENQGGVIKASELPDDNYPLW
jgi:hypothetical protein